MPKTTMAKNNAIELVFTMEKATKNTIRFTEKVDGTLDTPTLGTIYVPKATLKQMGWDESKQLKVTINC
jgi:hypothetical protein